MVSVVSVGVPAGNFLTLIFWTIDIPLSFMTGYLVKGIEEATLFF